ncbi:putative Bud site selection-related protein [Papiliotrema laurentii]|uniref:Bud site selection-related protein n=1 Tax=Papiliotrema laurentii TaxID=5418 RepID=A0AAD9FRK3_PAPLA|nr:putative Bud site selection-related protein [Papiliotrema laurentii]
MSDLKAYLASKYMSGPKAEAILARSSDPTIKKRKKKPKNEDYPSGSGSASASSGVVLKDEEDEWNRRTGADDLDLEGDDAPVIGKDVATFRKSNSAWNKVAASTSIPLKSSDITPKTEPVDPEDESAVAAASPPKQVTKRKGGLRTAAQMQEEAALAAAAAKSPSPEPDADRPDPTKTVHRDASGRVLDVEALKEEARKAEAEEKRKEKEREEWGKGITQRKEREERAQLEKEMITKKVERYADDVGMNRDMRDVERWNDPAAEFLTKKKRKGPRRPVYRGPYPPNRFGIPPGFRWDGVDRSTGFEKKFFQYQNAAVRAEVEANAWSMEDM